MGHGVIHVGVAISLQRSHDLFSGRAKVGLVMGVGLPLTRAYKPLGQTAQIILETLYAGGHGYHCSCINPAFG